MKLPDNFLERTGYRLPNESEWEYACRARSVSSRPFGQGLGRMSEYCWNEKNGGREMHDAVDARERPVGERGVADVAVQELDALGERR